NDISFSASGGGTISGAGTLILNGNMSGKGTIASNVALPAATHTLNTGNLTFTGVISGAGGLLVSGDDIFSNVNTYTGPTVITHGSVTLLASNALAHSDVTVGSAGALILTTFDQSLQSLTGISNLFLGS